MRPGSACLRGFAPTRTRPARGLGELTMPADWRLTPDEPDGDLVARDFAGSVITVKKSRLFSMTANEIRADETLSAYFLDAWKARRTELLNRGDPAWMHPKTITQVTSPPDELGMVEFAGGRRRSPGFVLGQCPDVDAMGWPLIGDRVQHTVCVSIHVALGVLALVGVMAAVWTLDTAGKLAGD